MITNSKIAPKYILIKSNTPITLENQKVLIDFQVQLKKSGYQNREELLSSRPLHSVSSYQDAAKLTDTQMASILKFAKHNKINWAMLVTLLGLNLDNPVDIAIGYKMPRYTKCFLQKCDIPFIDIAPTSRSVREWDQFSYFVNNGNAYAYIQRIVSCYITRDVYQYPDFDYERQDDLLKFYNWREVKRNIAAQS